MSNIISFSDMQNMAKAIADSGLFGMKDTNAVLALMAVAQAEGLHPATAARDFHIIQGKPALKADAMLARFQNAGGHVEWKEYTDERVTGIFRHPLGSELEVTWTIEQATRVGLVKPGSGWQKFPRAMLRSRCISEGIRSVFPGSVTGFYSPEEVQDFEPRDITPKTVTKALVTEPSVTVGTEITEIPDDLIDLFIPGQANAYASYGTQEEWVTGFCDIFERILSSTKLSDEEKHTKFMELRSANEDYTKTWDAVSTASFLGKLSMLRKAN